MDPEMAAKFDAILNKLEENRMDLQTSMDDKLCKLRNEFTQTSKDIKRLKADSEYSWRKEGNKIQFNFNSEVFDCLRRSQNADTEADSQALVTEAIGKLTHRNKLIKIADSSEGGWETVRNYVANDLAENSDDDKRIEKAESKACKKIRQRSKFRHTPLSTRSNRRVQEESVRPTSVSLNQPINQPFRDRGPRSGACFNCGDINHFRRDCPRLYRHSTSRQSTSTGPSQ